MKPLGNLIAVLYRKEQSYIHSIMEEYKLTPSAYKFMVVLDGNEGSNQRQLCEMLSIDEALATRAMKKLEASGYILRVKEREDSRSYCLQFTEKGREIAPLLKEKLSAFWDEMLSELEDNHKEQLYQALQLMADKEVKLEL